MSVARDETAKQRRTMADKKGNRARDKRGWLSVASAVLLVLLLPPKEGIFRYRL